jgi:hypothetical protein
MSLTEQGYRERKWGHFPALRKALEDKKIPESYYGLTSASDNMFEAMERLVEIAVLAVEYENAVKETAVSVGREEMYNDLRVVERSLERAYDFFKQKGENVRALYNAL